METPALDLTLSLDLRGIQPGARTRAHVVAEIRAAAAGVERERPPLSVIFAVDVSGSMAGPPIEQVALSIDRLVALLEPTDRVGVVAFSDGASEVVPLMAVGAEAKRLITSRVHRLHADGWTHVEAGLLAAAKMMPKRGEHERQVVLLLSDGEPNRGKATPDELAAVARSFRPDVAVSTLGYGAHHHEDVLARIAEAGAGRYHFIADPAVCAIELAQAIGAQGDAVAEAVELTLALAPGVEIARFYRRPEVRLTAGGIRIAAPDLLDGGSHVLVLEVELDAPREPGPWEALKATLAYRRAGGGDSAPIQAALSIPVGVTAVGPEPAARAQVLIAQADDARAEARQQADRGQFEGAAAILRRMIRLIEAEPGFSRNDGSPLAESLEQLVDEAVAMERKPNREDYQLFRKAQTMTPLLEPPPMSVASPLSHRMVSSVAGDLPRAALVMISGDAGDKRFPLDQPRITIGRTRSAHISIQEANVSRIHAVIQAQMGRFFIMDMRSSNTTSVNGVRLDRPVPLAPGDVVRIGDVELRYEEEPRG